MRRLAVAFLAAPLLAACTAKTEKVDTTTAAAAAPAPGAANTKADEDSLHAVSARMQAALTAHDSAGIAALYADDGTDYTPGMKPAHGQAELVKEYATMFGMAKDMKITMQPGSMAVAQGGDLAYSDAPYDMTWTDAKGKAMKDHGTVLIVWKKVNGAWKVVRSMNASDVAPGA